MSSLPLSPSSVPVGAEPLADSATTYHCRYWAQALTLRSATGSIEALSQSLAGARVDLNPHQVDAALFAVRSPLSKGAILADEVGLGKTIEAGIVMAQRWAERKRRILIVVPATLRGQWQRELATKFFLPTRILDTKVLAALVAAGVSNPFDSPEQIAICSYHFVSARHEEIARVPWDLVVVDEAHRLRNVYKTSSKLARRIVDATASAPKLLLTATPLQNTLLELYGLVSVVDSHIFGDEDSFRDRFLRADSERERNIDLRSRLIPVCKRTLRRQVTEYVPFTKRTPITQNFLPSDEEHDLYEAVSEYLAREHLVALPMSQRALITLVLRKLLASSSFAIADTLERLATRLETAAKAEDLLDDDDLDGVEELQDELEEEAEEAGESIADANAPATQSAPPAPSRFAAEIGDLRRFVERARRITVNAKGEALLPALRTAFEKATALGAKKKAVIFTESRRTQRYLVERLSREGYQGQVVTMNGSNDDPDSRRIFEEWKARPENKDKLTGSRAVDMKTAIVEQFSERAELMVATEAAAEGVNLQFCSLVVNYDLPWNPQRIEQRIGRCHRYGQKHDVVVVNFLNLRNEADQRVFAILSEKFKLFDGLFGSSDEVLGAVESGVEIEWRIAKVYQTCRSTEQIKIAFDLLQQELDEQIQERMSTTRQTLLEHFDEDVAARLRVHKDQTMANLGERERWLLQLTRTELGESATFESDQARFNYRGQDAPQGWYHLDWREAEKLGDTFYRQDHQLAQAIIQRALGRVLKPVRLTFDYSRYGQVISILKPLIGQSGWLELSKLKVESFGVEEFLVFAARTDNGQVLDDETCRKLLLLPATAGESTSSEAPDLAGIREMEISVRLKQVEERNFKLLEEEILKLDRWSDDLKQGLERELKEMDSQIRELRRGAVLAPTLQEKLDAQRAVKAIESERHRKRRDLFAAQDSIDTKRDELIGNLESQLHQRNSYDQVFSFRWSLR